MRLFLSLLLLLFIASPLYAQAMDFLHAVATDYGYKHKYIPNSNSKKTHISCSVKEKNNIFSNELTSSGINNFIFDFAIDTNKQIFYGNKQLENKVYLFDDDRIIFMTDEFKNRGTNKEYGKIRYNIINRKTGSYESFYLERWYSLSKGDFIVMEGKGLGSCEVATTNKF